ncbi:MAG TPA: PP2C family serine/threonine-protein phosphatase [Nocardioidaceae bacterium]|nr:PP2C family serine/threonine-protein phosphatase [Nocardioidaceae bacterium]
MTLSLRYAALSDVGRVRKDNQDSGFASEHLLVIADGVGGAARGDIASSTAVQILRRLDGPPPEDVLEAMAGAIHRAHDRIAELVDEDPELEGTSTTVTAALFDGNRIGVGHIGDSRGYLLRNGELSQLTKDHTFVQSLIDEGRITEEESRTHPHRNLILRAVDGVHETDPDLFMIELAPGDRLLLCSDGCSGVLDNDRLADILGTGTVDYAVVELVRASLDAGSTDNITCVVADVTDAAEAVDGETVAATATGPMLVGAAAEQPRKAGMASKSFFRGHRSGDTGEIEPVPGEPEPVDPEELRYAPRPPRRFFWLRALALLVVAGVLLWLGGMAAYSWTQNQYYVAADGQNVGIYRGVEAEVPGLQLSHLYEDTEITLASLPDYRADQVRGGISADDLPDARDIVSRLGDLARVCPTPEPSPSPSASPTTKDSPRQQETRRPRETKRAEAQASESPSPSASPSPTLAPPDCVEATQ